MSCSFHIQQPSLAFLALLSDSYKSTTLTTLILCGKRGKAKLQDEVKSQLFSVAQQNTPLPTNKNYESDLLTVACCYAAYSKYNKQPASLQYSIVSTLPRLLRLLWFPTMKEHCNDAQKEVMNALISKYWILKNNICTFLSGI